RDKYGVQMIMRFNEIHKFNDGTLHQIDEVLDYTGGIRVWIHGFGRRKTSTEARSLCLPYRSKEMETTDC
ncbi:hypothetical protein Tco_0314347, partial [Tanacetum coccineum]